MRAFPRLKLRWACSVVRNVSLNGRGHRDAGSR
jgi:hypothetical protein